MDSALADMEEILSRHVRGFHRYVLTPPAHLSYASRNLCELLGVREGELVDDEIDLYARMVHPADRETYADLIQGTTLGEGPVPGSTASSARTVPSSMSGTPSRPSSWMMEPWSDTPS